MNSPAEVRAVLLDIEGTTSSLSFVKDTLFPFAHRGLSRYVREHEAELAGILDEVREIEGNVALDTGRVIDALLRWMDEDRKITALKTLQGLIWRQGYESGELRGHVYADTVRALEAWQASGLALYVYSSGSVTAQQLLFSHTDFGDLTPRFSGYFDTSVGSKLQAASYAAIALHIRLPPAAVLFFSDHPGEIRAAQAAGLQAVRVDREAAADSTPDAGTIRSFDELMLPQPR
jgi:enolase-phosphatase E1